MPPLKTLLFLAGFVAATVGCLWFPLAGVLGYVLHYSIGPERQWWEAPISHLHLRYSFTLAAATAIGLLLHHRKLRWGDRLLTKQEVLMLVFLGVVWLTFLMGDTTRESSAVVDHPSMKVTKVFIFTLMLTHIVTRQQDLNLLFWAFTSGALILGLQAYYTPRYMFMQGRLETIGGPDFAEANSLAAYLAALLPIIGVQFMRSRWPARIACLAAGGLACNAIILTRSRGAIVALAAGGIAALFMAPKRYRAAVAVGLVVALVGFVYLGDVGFMGRMSTLNSPAGELDESAQSRIAIWRGGLKMIAAHPLGVGPGNFLQTIGHYAPNHANRDAHSTLIRCAAELGLVGLIVLIVLIVNAFRVLRNTHARLVRHRSKADAPLLLYTYAAMLALIIYLICGFFGSFVYIEVFWWLLALPVCLSRAVENAVAQPLEEGAPSRKRAVSRTRSRTPRPQVEVT